MRLEKCNYESDLPISIQICNMENYPPHYHQDIEIIYVLEGELQFRNGPFDYLLVEGDVFTNNRCEVHSMHATDKPNKIAMIKISSSFFTRYYPNIPTSTYMFYSDKEKVFEQEHLKDMILNLLDTHVKKTTNYKSKCIDATRNIIEYLNEKFNVFGFTKDQLCKFESNNPVLIRRLHDIIHYTYENHTTNISLDDLAELTHLNSYYISHIVKQTIGISFTQFLYFVRVEWSEVNLLNPRIKVSTIAKRVGFSSTAYYRQYFQYWYKCTPEEYRAKYVPLIKSEKNPEVYTLCETAESIEVVNKMLGNSGSNTMSNIHPRYIINKSFDVTCSQPAIRKLSHTLIPVVTLEDYHILKGTLFSYLTDLGVTDILLNCDEHDNPFEINLFHNLLIQLGLKVTLTNDSVEHTQIYGLDSLAVMFKTFNQHLYGDNDVIVAHLREQGPGPNTPIGAPTLLSRSGARKPMYYALKILTTMNGDLLSQDENHAFVRADYNNDIFVLLTYNYDESLEHLCTSSNTPYEVKSTISDFKTEIIIDLTLTLPKGKYFIQKFSFDEFNNYFNCLANMNFSDDIPNESFPAFNNLAAPHSELYETQIDNAFVLSNYFSGAGVQLNTLQRL